MNHEKIYRVAVENGCQPKWHDGIFGEAWHCMCDDNLHCSDQQCSMISEKSAKKFRMEEACSA